MKTRLELKLGKAKRSLTLRLPPGITINTSATDFYPIKQMRMERLNSERWELFGPIMSGNIGS